MSETDQPDNVVPISDFDKFAEQVKADSESIIAGIKADMESYNPPRHEPYQEEKLENFVCRLCMDNRGYTKIEIILDVVLGGIPKNVVVGYSCDNCCATFTNPQKFSLYEEKEQA